MVSDILGHPGCYNIAATTSCGLKQKHLDNELLHLSEMISKVLHHTIFRLTTL